MNIITIFFHTKRAFRELKRDAIQMKSAALSFFLSVAIAACGVICNSVVQGWTKQQITLSLLAGVIMAYCLWMSFIASKDAMLSVWRTKFREAQYEYSLWVQRSFFLLGLLILCTGITGSIWLLKNPWNLHVLLSPFISACLAGTSAAIAFLIIARPIIPRNLAFWDYLPGAWFCGKLVAILQILAWVVQENVSYNSSVSLQIILLGVAVFLGVNAFILGNLFVYSSKTSDRRQRFAEATRAGRFPSNRRPQRGPYKRPKTVYTNNNNPNQSNRSDRDKPSSGRDEGKR